MGYLVLMMTKGRKGGDDRSDMQGTGKDVIHTPIPAGDARATDGSGDFAALFAMLDEPLAQGVTDAGYARMLGKVASPSFQRETLKRRD